MAFTLYTAPTPNGWKISIALEEMGLPYEVKVVDFASNEQKSPWYVKLNPNGRIPTLLDDGFARHPRFRASRRVFRHAPGNQVSRRVDHRRSLVHLG